MQRICFKCLLVLIVILFGCASEKDSGAFSLRTLILSDAETGKVYATWPVNGAAGDVSDFAIEFIHSVNQSPVRDYFAVEGKIIRPLATQFHAFGAGMQSDLEPGEALSRIGGAMVITGFKQTFKELNYIVGTVSDHLLFVDGKIISLRDLCGRNAHLIIKVK